MKKVRPWVEALGIAEEDYQRWCSSVPADESVTFRCLREGRIPIEAYLDWACNFYELPILQKAFFENPPDAQIFSKLKTIGSWSREMMPVGEWDGVIYVACTEPVEEITWSFNVCYLLAQPEHLEAHWKILNGIKPLATPPLPGIDEITKTAVPKIPDVPVPMDVPVENPVALLKPKKAPVVAQAPAASAPPAMPETTAVTSFANIEEAASAPMVATEAASTVPTTPAKEMDPFASLEMELTKTSAPVAAVMAPEGVSLSTAPAVAEMPAGLDAPAGLEAPASVSQDSGISKVDVAPEGLSMPEMPENTSVTSISPKIQANVVASASISTDANAMQAMAQEFFKELKNDFLGCMLLSFDGDNLKPMAWDEKWKSVGATQAFISLSNASAFRVVFRTKMPYLGHVVNTASNTDFFKSWGNEQLPENILVQPIIENGKWYGMLLLLADKNKKQASLLTLAEQISARLANVMAKSTAKKVA